MKHDIDDAERVDLGTRRSQGQRGTLLIHARGLCAALVENSEHLDNAASDVLAAMEQEHVPSGVLILSQPLAATMYGPVPAGWLDAGISMHASTHADLATGAAAFLSEYLQMVELMARSLADLRAMAEGEATQSK